MKLDVLARRDVAEAPRVPLADFGQCHELIARQDALGDLHAEHLSVSRLPLPVRPANQPEGTPLVGRQFAALVALERLDELVDVGLARKRKAGAAMGVEVLG
jgi:hypothetical protein